MAVKAAGSPLALTEIQAEFGGSNPIGLNEYYRGGGLVPSGPTQNANIPTSGAIGMYAFYGAVRSFVLNQTISSNTTNYNLRNSAVAAGWDQSTPLIATVTVNAGVYVSANGTGTYAFDTGASFPAGSSLSLVNNGFIVGMGGAGGAGSGWSFGNTIAGSGGASGGPALRAQAAISITNNGTIAGGGGGGGGGQGVAIGSSDGKSNYGAFGGGGGGGGRSGASANSAGGGGGPVNNYGYSSAPGGAGGAGTSASAGGGGNGGTYLSGSRGGAGGAGGAWGTGGGSGGSHVIASGNDVLLQSYGGPYGAGGGGAAVAGNGNISWAATGTRLGAIA